MDAVYTRLELRRKASPKLPNDKQATQHMAIRPNPAAFTLAAATQLEYDPPPPKHVLSGEAS